MRPSPTQPRWPRFRFAVAIRALVLCGMLASLTVSTYYWMRKETTQKVLHRFNYGEQRFGTYDRSVRPEWRPRVGSTMLVRAFHDSDPDVMQHRVALLFACGLLLCGAIYVLIDWRAAAFLTLGTFAGLVYAGSPRAENTWYPWDVPALVLSAACLGLALGRRRSALAAVILVGVAFKETLLVMVIYFLFLPGHGPRLRAAWAGGVAAIGLGLRAVLEQVAGGTYHHSNHLHVHGKPDRELRLQENLGHIFDLNPNHVVWTNVGLWLLVFLIPTRRPELVAVRWVALAMYAGLVLAGSLNEFRIFLELLPGSLLLAHGLFAPETTGEGPVAGHGQR